MDKNKCSSCGEAPHKCSCKNKEFTKAVIEIDNPEQITLMRKVVIPASMGDDTTVPPTIGKYHNVLLYYEANSKSYLYSSDGIPTQLVNGFTNYEEAINLPQINGVTLLGDKSAADLELADAPMVITVASGNTSWSGADTAEDVYNFFLNKGKVNIIFDGAENYAYEIASAGYIEDEGKLLCVVVAASTQNTGGVTDFDGNALFGTMTLYTAGKAVDVSQIELQPKLYIADFTGLDLNYNELSGVPATNASIGMVKPGDGLEVASDGTLSISDIEQYAHFFDTVADMKAGDLADGDYARTGGFYAPNDGGDGMYRIRLKTSSDTVDNGSIMQMGSVNLVAELIIDNNQISVRQFGAYGDDTHDDTDAFNAAIAYVGIHHGKLYFDKGVYKLSSKLTVDWNSGNFNLAFNQSFELFGAGQLETKLHFTSSDGLDVNPNNNGLVIKIHDFCIENSDYNNLEDTGNVRTPDLTHGVGLKVKHIGYMGHVSDIAVRGFYVGIMSTNCYGGPIFENLFVKNAVFGYYSTGDTSIEHNSCSYVGCECCYLQNGCRSTLTNVICESNQHFFVTNEYNQRSKFEGIGFQFTGSANVVCDGCYTEDLYGNGIKIVNSAVIDNLGTYNNFMHSHLTQPAYADLAQWLAENPDHNYDDIYVSLNSANRNLVLFNGTQIDTSGTAYVDVYQSSTLLSETSAVEFRGMAQTGAYATNVERYNKGHTQPILSFNRSASLNGSTIGFTPDKTYGIPEFYNMLQPTSNTGNNSLVVTRKATYTDTSYDEVKLIVKHALDGSIRVYRSTFLNGTQVAQVEVIRIGNDNRVTFPQN